MLKIELSQLECSLISHTRVHKGIYSGYNTIFFCTQVLPNVQQYDCFLAAIMSGISKQATDVEIVMFKYVNVFFQIWRSVDLVRRLPSKTVCLCFLLSDSEHLGSDLRFFFPT